jgi:hypothetical protein
MIVGLSGFARSGKDTVANLLVEKHDFIRVAFADLIRESLLILNPYVGSFRLQEYVLIHGWDNAKSAIPEIRRLLQVFGTEIARDLYGESFWLDQLQRRYDLTNPNKNWVISDVRYDNEAQMIHDNNGEVWNIIRPGVGPVNEHSSDKGITDSYINRIILNNAGSKFLEDQVSSMVPKKKTYGFELTQRREKK